MSGCMVILPMWPTEASYASPVLTQSTAGTASLTRYKRTNRSSDDKELRSADGFEEEDLRAGGPNLCEPPCFSIHLAPHHALYDTLAIQQEHRHGIQALAGQNDITISDISFVGRKSRCDPTDTPPILTALLTVHRQNPTNRGWAQFARKVWNYLNAYKLGDISVEIVDQRFNKSPYIFPCKETDAIYPIWEAVCGRILAKTDLNGIHSVGCHRIGNAQEPDSCMPNILVAVSAKCHRNWNQVREAILSILMEFHLHTVGVIIRKDVSLLGSGVLSAKALQSRECTPEVGFGCSLGPHGSQDDQGTLGGVIELKNPDSGQWVGFVILDWKRNGVRVGDKNATRLLPVDSPSQRDVQGGIDNLSELISEIRRNPTYERVERAIEQDEYVIGPDKGLWKAYGNQIRVLDRERGLMQAYLNNNQHMLGSVFAGSGFREERALSVVPNINRLPTVRDWALVKPTKGRSFGSNDFIKCSQLQGVERMDFLPHGESLRAENTLCQMGRKTGETQGKYNGLKTARIAREYIGGSWVEKATFEHTVVSNNRKDVFEMGGDSGAFVYTITGHVVGMCLGGPLHGEVGYFSHIHDILDDIQKVTGVKEIRLKR
ncbi:hypothetical protein BJX76DRAFT_354593 [Aspergillus varians]